MTHAPDSLAAWHAAIPKLRRSVKVYKPAILLAALDVMEPLQGIAVPFEPVRQSFIALLSKVRPARKANARNPFMALASDKIWTVSDGRELVEKAAEPAVMATFAEPFAAAVATPEGRRSIREQVYALLEADQSAESTALLKAHRNRS